MTETDEILELIKNYSVFYYNYFYESDWIRVDNKDALDGYESCYRAENVSAEQFFGKLNAYATENLADKLTAKNEYVADSGKLYTSRPGGEAGWGICEVKLTLDSVEYPDDTTVKVNLTGHNEDPETHKPMEDDKFTVILKRTSEGLRVDGFGNDDDMFNTPYNLHNYGQIYIGDYSFGF